MPSIENSLKHEAEAVPGKVRLVASGEFVRAYDHSAWLFYCCISKYKVIRKFSKAQQRDVYFLGFPTSKLLELANGRSYEKPGCGLPIGNLSSQLFSNVYLGAFDDYMKRDLKCRHYGRYVDDAFVLAPSKEELFAIVPKVRKFLRDELALELNEDKVHVVDARRGVEFLGAFVKPYRTYPANRSLRRIRGRMKSLDWGEGTRKAQARVNSMLGVLSHYDCWHLRRVLTYESGLRNHGRVSDDGLRFFPENVLFF